MIDKLNAQVLLDGAEVLMSAGRPAGSGSALVILVGAEIGAEIGATVIERPEAKQ